MPVHDHGNGGERDRLRTEAIRKRQRGRAIVTALVLGALVVLFYAISIVKMM